MSYDDGYGGTRESRVTPTSEGVIRQDAAALIASIQALEDRAHRIGMTRAAQALNHAKNEAGWGLADLLEKVTAAESGEEGGDG